MGRSLASAHLTSAWVSTCAWSDWTASTHSSSDHCLYWNSDVLDRKCSTLRKVGNSVKRVPLRLFCCSCSQPLNIWKKSVSEGARRPLLECFRYSDKSCCSVKRLSKDSYARSTVVLNVGDEAPDFDLEAVTSGRVHRVKLSDYRGRNVVIAFHPLDWTPT